MKVHSGLTGSDATHQVGYVDTVDPGAVGAYKVWFDSTATPYTIKVRNGANSGWVVAGTVSTPELPTGGTTGQVLAKVNATDYNVSWQTISPLGDVVTTPAASQTIQAQGAAVIPINVKGHASQSTDIFRVSDSAGNVLASFTSAGQLFLRKGLLSDAGAANPGPTYRAYRAGALGVAISTQHSRTDTMYVDAASQANDLVAYFSHYGNDGDEQLEIARTTIMVDGSVANNSIGGKFIVSTRPSASGGVLTPRTTIDSTGLLAHSYALQFSGVSNPTSFTSGSTNNNLDPGAAWMVRLAAAGISNLTGLAGGAQGKIHRLVNTSAYDIYLKHQVTSSASNQFACPSSADFILRPGATVDVAYDAVSLKWRLAADTTTRSYVDVREYPTWVTDKAGAIQAALNTAGVYEVFVPNGTHVLGSVVTAGTGQHILGESKRGCILQRGYTNIGALDKMIILGTGATISNLTVDGKYDTLGNQTTGSRYEIFLGDHAVAENVRMINFAQFGIGGNGSNYAKVRFCEIIGNGIGDTGVENGEGYVGIIFFGDTGTNPEVTGCYVSDMHANAINMGATGGRITNCTFVNNHRMTVITFGGAVDVTGKDVTVANNYFIGTGGGSGTCGIESRARGALIEGNTFIGMGSNAIYVAKAGAGSFGRTRIIGNIIKNSGYLSASTTQWKSGIYVVGGTPLSTTLALIANVAATQVRLTSITNASVGDWITIAGGTFPEKRKITAIGAALGNANDVGFTDALVYSHASGSAVTEPMGEVSIIGNDIQDDDLTPTQTYAIYLEAGALDNIIITGNDLRNNVTGALFNGATGTEIIIHDNLPKSVNVP